MRKRLTEGVPHSRRFGDVPERDIQQIEAATQAMVEGLLTVQKLRPEDVFTFSLVELVSLMAEVFGAEVATSASFTACAALLSQSEGNALGLAAAHPMGTA